MKFKLPKNQIVSQVVILSMVFGFGAGVVGQIVADVYIDPYGQDLLYQNLNTNINAVPIIPELRRVKKFLGIEQDFEVNNSIRKITPALVGIYLEKKESNNALNQIYLPQDLQTNGFILTSDGWLVSYGEVFTDFKTSQLVVIYNEKIFKIEEVITDSITNVVFLKIPANNLPVVVLGDSDEAILGQLAIVLNNLDEAVVVNIKNTNYWGATSGSDFVVTSEGYGESFLLTDSLEETYLGSPLINLGGEVVGIIKEIDQNSELVTAVPINQFRLIILDVLRSHIVKRPFLGVSYIDLAWVIGLDPKLTQGQNRGALVWQNPKRLTPAADVTLKEDDIILSIDGQLVDKNNSLTELIQQYRAGDEIILEILRDNKTISRTVTLAVLPD